MLLAQLLLTVLMFQTAFAQLAEEGASCVKPGNGSCQLQRDCPTSLIGETCGSDEKHNILYCCQFPVKSLQYYSARYLPQRTECGRIKGLQQIRHGSKTDLGEFPWIAALLYVSTEKKQYGGVQCAGSLINEIYVVTAAHCVQGYEAESIRVLLGEWNITRNPDCITETNCADEVVNATIEVITPHPYYDNKLYRNDIALLKLNKSVEFTDYVRPICLPHTDMPKLKPRDVVIVAGWGATEKSGQSDVLLKTSVGVLQNDDCLRLISRKEILETEICAAHAESDACSGDSGGPLVAGFYDQQYANLFLQGIVGFGTDCSFDSGATVYTRVLSYVNWIINTITEVKGRNSACFTVDLTDGKCVFLSHCPKLEILYLGLKNNSEAEFVRRSLCGSEDGLDLVCCKLSDITTATTATTPETIVENLEYFDNENLPNRTICGLVKTNDQKAFGSETRVGEFPWLAALVYRSRSNGSYLGVRCAGSLINHRYVLTTAHCLGHSDVEPFRVLLGHWKLSEKPDCSHNKCTSHIRNVTIDIETPHPFYSENVLSNDVALLRLGSDIEFTDYIRPICLPPPSLPVLKRDTEMTVAGWRVAVNGTHSDIALKATVNLLEDEECLPISSNQFCAGNKTVDACIGDHGGPLMRNYRDHQSLNWFLEGLVVLHLDCEYQPSATIYIHVSKYTDWILRTIDFRPNIPISVQALRSLLGGRG